MITTVTVAEGKKSFSRLLHDASENKEEIIVTRRGKPVAVIVPYDKYRCSRRAEGYRKIMEVRLSFIEAGVSADEVFKESKKQLEGRS